LNKDSTVVLARATGGVDPIPSEDRRFKTSPSDSISAVARWALLQTFAVVNEETSFTLIASASNAARFTVSNDAGGFFLADHIDRIRNSSLRAGFIAASFV
jgi:hypothetical protein